MAEGEPAFFVILKFLIRCRSCVGCVVMLMCCYHVEIVLLRVACSQARKKGIFVILKKTKMSDDDKGKKKTNVGNPPT